MANQNETVRKILKQSQSMIASNFNKGEHLRNTTQAAAANYHVSVEQSAALDLSINEDNAMYEALDNVSCCSSLRAVEIIDSDEEDIAELNEILLKLKSIGAKMKSVASNQVNVINTIKKNSKKISDLEHNTAKQFNEFTDFIVDRIDIVAASKCVRRHANLKI